MPLASWSEKYFLVGLIIVYIQSLFNFLQLNITSDFVVCLLFFWWLHGEYLYCEILIWWLLHLSSYLLPSKNVWFYIIKKLIEVKILMNKCHIVDFRLFFLHLLRLFHSPKLWLLLENRSPSIGFMVFQFFSFTSKNCWGSHLCLLVIRGVTVTYFFD